ncbi:MAG TPA: hypothetical protein VLM41_01585 [Steroidobacteraceae bacterium]|nr:hypothetical protein [Steroidobacteraceae bacterium]
MIAIRIPAATIVLAAFAAWAQPTLADSAEATCEVSKDGDKWKGATGPCTFSQRQGYIDLDLRNGDSYSLAPSDKANHYKDQRGNKVVRSQNSNGSEVFKWEGGKKVVLTYVAGGNAGHSGHAAYKAGETAPDLADLVGAKAGQAEGELQRRGYQYAKGSTSGNAKYSSYFNASTGRCVMIRTEDGRYQSIVQAPPFDCGR